MDNLFKRIILGILFAVCLLLAGCVEQQTQDTTWNDALDALKNRQNYTVVEAVTTGDEEPVVQTSCFNGKAAYHELTDGTCYYEKDGNTTYCYVRNDDPDIWIKTAVDYNERYFYSYRLIERLNKYAGFIDMGYLTYDVQNSRYITGEQPIAYCIDDTERVIDYAEIILTDGQITMLRERYRDADADVVSVITISDCGTTAVRLPIDVITDEEAKTISTETEDSAEEETKDGVENGSENE